MGLAFDYATTHSIETEADYPYYPYDDTCAYEESKGIAKATGKVWVTKNDPAAL